MSGEPARRRMFGTEAAARRYYVGLTGRAEPPLDQSIGRRAR